MSLFEDGWWRKSFRVLGFRLAIHLHIRMYAHLLHSMVTAGKTKTMEGKQTGDWAASGSLKGYVEEVLAQHPAMFSKLLEHAPRFRFQVLLSHVVQDPVSSSTHLVRHGYRVDHEYFYPASAIKLCAAVAAVEKLKHIQASLEKKMSCTMPLELYSLFEGTEDDRMDASNLSNHHITVAHEIRKIFLVSDNKAFNRLFSFVGHRTLNQAMWNLGLQTARLQHRLSVVRSRDTNRLCEPLDLNVSGITLTLPPKQSQLLLPDDRALPGIRVGKAYITDDGNLVPEPMDFSMKNYMSLMDQQNLLIKLVRPDIQLDTPAIQMDEGLRMLLMEAMSQYPAQSSNPLYHQSDYPDDYCKFFLPGLSRVRAKGALRIYNKIGRAYGFTIDNSYIFDLETGQNFFLSAVLYTNDNEILNDDRYEYEVADRAMADLAEVLARALWQIPPSLTTLSTPFDCIPSSLWSACTQPLIPQSPGSACEGAESKPDGEPRSLLGVNVCKELDPDLQQSKYQIVYEFISRELKEEEKNTPELSPCDAQSIVTSAIGHLVSFPDELDGSLLDFAQSSPGPCSDTSNADTSLSLDSFHHDKYGQHSLPLIIVGQPQDNLSSSGARNPEMSYTESLTARSKKDEIRRCYKFFVDE